MGVLAKGIKHHEGYGALVHHGAHHQAMAGRIGKAGLGQLDAPVRLAHQGIGIAETQGVVGLVEGHGLFAGGAELLDQWIGLAGLEQFDQVIGAGDVPL